MLKAHDSSVLWYMEATVSYIIYFPEGKVICRFCPVCSNRDAFGNFLCKAIPTAPVIVPKEYLDSRHPACPIRLQETPF